MTNMPKLQFASAYDSCKAKKKGARFGAPFSRLDFCDSSLIFIDRQVYRAAIV